MITNVRGKGLMIAVDIVSKSSGKPEPELRARILQECFSRGIVLLGCGSHSIRFIPPLCINKTQMDVGLKVFDESLATVS
jgi:4-aminobutyrate aminotransferase